MANQTLEQVHLQASSMFCDESTTFDTPVLLIYLASPVTHGRCITGEFGVDASFHSQEWHAARIAALTTERLTWDEWKEQQKEHLMSEEAMVRQLPDLLHVPSAAASRALLPSHAGLESADRSAASCHTAKLMYSRGVLCAHRAEHAT